MTALRRIWQTIVGILTALEGQRIPGSRTFWRLVDRWSR